MTQSMSRLLLSWMGVLCMCGFPAKNAWAAETVFPSAAWQRATPESQGVDSAKLKEAVDFMDQEFGSDGAKELVIVRNGYLIWEGSQADAYHPIWSCTKTFTSTVLGLLIDDRRCTLDTKAVEREGHLADQNPLYSRIRLRDLASMCGGYQGEVKDVREDQPWGDPMAFLNPQKPWFEPGTIVQYNDHDVFLLGKILTLLAQKPLRDVFQRRIAGPIGMTRWAWGVSGTVDGVSLNNPPGNPGLGFSVASVPLCFIPSTETKGNRRLDETFSELTNVLQHARIGRVGVRPQSIFATTWTATTAGVRPVSVKGCLR